MSKWVPNIGSSPNRGRPPEQHLDRVYVRLRNGSEPKETWPVDTVRDPTTRWTLQEHSHDITHWREP